MENNFYTIDASGKVLGRLASKVAMILMGKNKPDFLPYKLSKNKVVVFNVSKIVLTGNKTEDKRYYRHSGYLGGIRFSTFREVSAKNPTEPFRRAVSRMLPKNKLRDKMIKNLKLYAGEYKEQKK
jgi:large subunit ribosomal protein L13